MPLPRLEISCSLWLFFSTLFLISCQIVLSLLSKVVSHLFLSSLSPVPSPSWVVITQCLDFYSRFLADHSASGYIKNLKQWFDLSTSEHKTFWRLTISHKIKFLSPTCRDMEHNYLSPDYMFKTSFSTAHHEPFTSGEEAFPPSCIRYAYYWN